MAGFYGSLGLASDAARVGRPRQGEKRTGETDANRPDWYARYMVAEQAGTELPTQAMTM